jgi:hypothetical protein
MIMPRYNRGNTGILPTFNNSNPTRNVPEPHPGTPVNLAAFDAERQDSRVYRRPIASPVIFITVSVVFSFILIRALKDLVRGERAFLPDVACSIAIVLWFLVVSLAFMRLIVSLHEFNVLRRYGTLFFGEDEF